MRRLASAIAALALSCSRSPPRPSSSTAPPDAQPAAALRGAPCGALECRQYETPADAFLAALAGAHPLVLGGGEAHAPKGAAVPTAAVRFAAHILPAIAGRTSHLLAELMLPPRGGPRAA